MDRISPRDLVLVGLVALAWGAAFTAGHLAVDTISPYSVAALRYLLATALLLAMLHARESLPATIAKLTPVAVRELVILALFSVVGYNVFLFTGLRFSTAINASLFAALAPLLTALFAAIVLREKLRRRQLVGMVISLSGLIVLVSHGSLAVLLGLDFNIGDLLIMCAVTCFAAQSIAAKRAMKHVSPFAATTFSCAIGAVMLLPFLVHDVATGWRPPSLESWLAVLYLGTIGTVLAYYVWFRLVGKYGAARMSPFINIIPVAGVLVGIAFGAPLELAQVIAGVLVLAGVTIATMQKKSA